MQANRSEPKDRNIDFGDGYEPIVVQYNFATKYYKCTNFKNSPGINWIEFCVHHGGVLNYLASRKQVLLDALFDAVEGEQFYPVNYQTGRLFDRFLARTCTLAVSKLFKRGLSLRVVTGTEVPLTVWFNVAEYNVNQISPVIIVSQVIDRLMGQLETLNGVSGVMNLSKFGEHPSFKHFEVRLSNKATLQLACTTIHNNDDRRRAIKGFNLSHNQISDLGPLRIFGDCDYALLDLSNNKLSSIKRLCTDLQRIRAKQLYLANNPITNSPNYPDCLKPLSDNFQMVNGVPFDKLYKLYTPQNYEIDMDCDGVLINLTNQSKLAQFKDSLDWHAFLIPDRNHQFTKEDLFNFFFIQVSPEKSEFYPCYYKYDEGEHRFLVRECYDQIEHLVVNCNLEIKIPQLVNSRANADVQEFSCQRTVPYYLRMNVSTMKGGHLEPKQCIEQALQKRFNAINRVLNLEQFQSCESLDNVIVCLSCTNILSSILRMASRKFVGNCIELRLGHNKIVSLGNIRPLSLLNGLQALDLGQNWIYDLSELSALTELSLKSLRLHGNPVCSKYALPSDYIQAVKKICPGLLHLDDVDLSTKPGFSTKKNYLCDTAAYELVSEQFLCPFLREFENPDQRINLGRFYTDNSVFTLTCSYDIRRAQPMKDLSKRINKYNYFSRNLLKNSRDICRINVGEHDIMQVVMQLPEVRHDFISLQTDVMLYDNQMAFISVNGVLRDEPDLILAFSRQFLLKVDAVGLGVGKAARRMKIINESFNILNPSRKQLNDAFKFLELPILEPDDMLQTEDTVEVKEHKLLIFQEITGLRPKWCTRIVEEEANWNFQLALEKFVHMNSTKELPNDAFL